MPVAAAGPGAVPAVPAGDVPCQSGVTGTSAQLRAVRRAEWSGRWPRWRGGDARGPRRGDGVGARVLLEVGVTGFNAESVTRSRWSGRMRTGE